MKKIVKTIGVIAVLFVGVSFFLPSKIVIQREIQINKNVDEVFPLVSDLKMWVTWMPWIEMDPNMDLMWGSVTKGLGASYSWESEEVGSGNMEIINITENKSILTELDFGEQGTCEGFWYFDDNQQGVNVQWGMQMDLGYNPFFRWLGLFMDGMAGPDFEKGLNNLKEMTEQKKN
jgi:hypothetical protein